MIDILISGELRVDFRVFCEKHFILRAWKEDSVARCQSNRHRNNDDIEKVKSRLQ